MAITPLPTAPQRGDRTNFRNHADAWVAALSGWTAQVNALAVTVEGYKDDAEQAVTDAQAQVALATGQVVMAESAKDNAEVAANTALTAANFAGVWGSLTGALAKNQTVLHDDLFWMLLVDLADVTTSEPAIGNADWQILASVGNTWEIGTTQSVTFDDPTDGDITQSWAVGAVEVASMLTEFGTAVGGEEQITQTLQRAGRTIETVTTFEADGSITITQAEVV